MKNYWKKLLSDSRLGEAEQSKRTKADRSHFDADYDRIVFSSAFRRLQDKTQVFPISQSDYARTRLTHSIEVASVGRSLGRSIGLKLAEKGEIDRESVTDLGAIVAAACLAHDIGNPPFGHSGEAAIQAWAQKEFARTPLGHPHTSDFVRFEGNAQAFRILTRLQDRSREGGMQMTYAVLGALLKYPTPSAQVPEEYRDYQAFKKWGYFQADSQLFQTVVEGVGLKELKGAGYARHPLAYLVEAADDICYAIVDLEDAHKAGILSYEALDAAFSQILKVPSREKIKIRYKDDATRVNVIRAKVIGKVIDECAATFDRNYSKIKQGKFKYDLISQSKYAKAFKQLKEIAKDKVYTDERILQIEVAGFKALGGLLDLFSNALIHEPSASASKKLQRLLPTEYMCLAPADTSDNNWSKDKIIDKFLARDRYDRYLAVTDYVSGMTDRFAVDLYQKLSGIKLA